MIEIVRLGRIIVTCSLLLLSLEAHAQADANSEKDHFVLSARTGFQKENFRWSIAGDTKGNNPNILSELIWKNLTGPLMNIDARYTFLKSFSITADYTQSFISSGMVTDTDYHDDNRTNSTYHDSFNSNTGGTLAFYTTLGYTLIQHKAYYLNAFAGYTLNRQSVYLLGSDNTGNKLRSTYKTTWQGLRVGINTGVSVTKNITIEAAFFYHQLDYTGTADWNLINTFQHPVSFKQTAKGFEVESTLKLQYRCTAHWSVFLKGQYTTWRTGHGVDQLYRIDGQIITTQFNGAKRNTQSLSIGASLNF